MWHTNAAVVPTRAWPGVAHGREGWPGRADARRFLPCMAWCDVSRGVGVADVRGCLWRLRWCDGVGVLRRGGEGGVEGRERRENVGAGACKARQRIVAGCGTLSRGGPL